MKKTILLTALTVIALSQLEAKNYYVTPSGTGDGTLSSPFGSIAAAAKLVTAGDTVFISGGTYSEMDITPNASGSETKGNIVFYPWPETGRPVMSRTSNTSSDESLTIFNLSSRSYIKLEGIYFKDITYLKSCIDMTKASRCVVTGCQFINLGNQEVAPSFGGTSMLWLNNAQNCVVSSCYFNSITGDAITLYGQDTHQNLICHNTFESLKGKKRSWASAAYKYSSAVTGGEDNMGENLICFNSIIGGQDGIWFDRDLSRNIVVRNFGNGGQRLVFNESRCFGNWIQENIAVNMTDAGYRSATYDGTNWSFDTRYINNVAYNCKYGMYLHKSRHNEVRNNIMYNNTTYNLVMTDSAVYYGENTFRNNLWFTTSTNNCIQYQGISLSPYTFANRAGETNGIYSKAPDFLSAGDIPSGYLLMNTSVCRGAGDGGVDVGAYPVYSYSDMGCDASSTTGYSSIFIEDPVSEVLRGEEYTIKVRLDKTSTDPVTVKLLPVAGDAVDGVDYEFKDSIVTFQPGEQNHEVTIRFIGEDTDFGKLLLLRLCSSSLCTGYAAYKILTHEEYNALRQTDQYFEAEDGTVGSLWQTLSDSNASGGKYVTVKSGNNSSSSAPTSTMGWIDIPFEIQRPTTYVLWLRTICANANDDSFWLRLDDGTAVSWNGIPTSSIWQWNKCPTTFTMQEGEHTLHIGYREDGAKLDKLLFTCIGTVPQGKDNATGIYTTASDTDATPIDVQYYDLCGRRIVAPSGSGIVIRRSIMSDGSIKNKKILIRTK